MRPANTEFSVGVQHEVMPRVGMSFDYFRRVYSNFTITDNRAVAATDFSPFQITAPLDPRLPDGGGYVVSDLYNLNPNKVGQVDNYVTLASNFGKQIEHWNGIDLTVNARLERNVLLQGGVSTGRTSTDNCDVLAQVIETNPVNLPSLPRRHEVPHPGEVPRQLYGPEGRRAGGRDVPELPWTEYPGQLQRPELRRPAFTGPAPVRRSART